MQFYTDASLQRGCLFNFERTNKFGGSYSYADCILRCKIYNYLHLCDCIPYMLPINFPDFGDEIKNATRCNLSHLRCLERYRSEFNCLAWTLDVNIEPFFELSFQ